jgi:hypothetical protein
MSSGQPPKPEGERWAARYVSSNGASASTWSDPAYRLVVAGYIVAIAMPPVGFVLAIVLARRSSKPYSKHWPWIMLISVIAAVGWTLILASGALTSTSNELN